MCVYVFAYVYVNVFVYVCVCKCVCMWVCVYVFAYVYVNVFVNVFVYGMCMQAVDEGWRGRAQQIVMLKNKVHILYIISMQCNALHLNPHFYAHVLDDYLFPHFLTFIENAHILVFMSVLSFSLWSIILELSFQQIKRLESGAATSPSVSSVASRGKAGKSGFDVDARAAEDLVSRVNEWMNGWLCD